MSEKIVQGDHDAIRVQLSVYRGQERLDIRYQYVDREGDLRPTKRGISIPFESAPQVLQAIQQVIGSNGR